MIFLCLSKDDNIKEFVDDLLREKHLSISDILLNKFDKIVKNHSSIVLKEAEENNINARVHEILHPVVYKKFTEGQILEKIFFYQDGKCEKYKNSMMKYYILLMEYFYLKVGRIISILLATFKIYQHNHQHYRIDK